MCDYSLEMYASRPAREGEGYITTRFPSGSLGLTAPGNCSTAICVQYDSRLELRDIPAEVQMRYAISPREEVTFVRLFHGAYRDGIEFAGGRRISLQLLGSGVGVALLPSKVPEKAAAAGEPAATGTTREPELV